MMKGTAGVAEAVFRKQLCEHSSESEMCWGLILHVPANCPLGDAAALTAVAFR